MSYQAEADLADQEAVDLGVEVAASAEADLKARANQVQEVEEAEALES